MKTVILRLAVLSVLSMGLNACMKSTQNSFTDADKEAIKKNAVEAIKGLNETKDYTAYVNAYYADNANFLISNSEPIQGKENIVNVLKTFGELKFEFDVVDIDGKDDLAYVYGKYRIEFVASGMKDTGKYVEIWRKQANGDWRVVYDINNTSVPLPTERGE